MLWSEQIAERNSREMKRLWLAGTIAAGLCADGDFKSVAENAVLLADQLLAELAKEKTK